MMQYIILWNTRRDNGNKIKDDDFTKKLKALQGKKVPEFRGDFSHGKREGESLLPHLQDRNDILKLLSTTEAMSNFVIEEIYGLE